VIFRDAKRQKTVRSGKTVLPRGRYSRLPDERTRLLVDEVLMSENEIVRKRSPLNPSLPAPLLSSIELGWKGLVVERYSVPPCELPDVPIVDHIVELVSQEHVSVGERPDWRGRLRPYSKYPGTSNFFPDGIRPKIHSFTQTDLIVCGLDPEFVEQLSGELDSNCGSQLREQLDVHDDAIAYFMRLFENAAKSGQPNKLYVDHLIYAFTLRLFSLGQDRKFDRIAVGLECARGGLSREKLMRALEYIQEQLETQLTVSGIARAVHMSPYHFTRLFKQSTGKSPYRYVIEARARKAKELLASGEFSIIEIAHRLNFADQSHLTRHLKHLFGLTPKLLQQRRDL
jgi:AraC family transcriptional regulator